MVSHLFHTTTFTGYFGFTGYEKEAQGVKKILSKFIQTAKCGDKESKFKVVTCDQFSL